MQETLKKLKEKRPGDEGFTLIELLVVVVIIGVLVAIAIPVYLKYSEGAQNKSAQADVRGGISAVENFYIQNSNNLPDNAASAAAGGAVTLTITPAPTGLTVAPGKITVSEGNRVEYRKGTTAGTYVICGQNTDGKKIYLYNSATGGSVKDSTQTTVATCASSGT